MVIIGFGRSQACCVRLCGLRGQGSFKTAEDKQKQIGNADLRPLFPSSTYFLH